MGRSITQDTLRTHISAQSRELGTRRLNAGSLQKARLVNQKVLFVDDEPALLSCYKQMLESKFDIATATSGEEGLTMLCAHGPFAAVVTDMQMTGMDGVQFLKRAREITPNAMRLLLTDYLDLQGAVNAVNEGCIFRLIMKPCSESSLTETITEAVDCYNDRKEERVRIEIPVRLYGPGRSLKVQLVQTVDISNSGVRLARVQEPLEAGEVVTLECGHREAPFRVVWTGEPGTSKEGQAGLVCLAADADLWKLDLRQLEDSKPLLRARAVQRGLLPQLKPPLKTLDYAGKCIQARMVGGDYYDFLDMGPGEVGFVLADVAGKGIPAALLMASLQASLYTHYSAGSKDIPQLLSSVNRHFYMHTANDRYATLFFGRYSDATRTMQYVNCGHNPPLLLRKAGAVEKLAATATVLGLFPDWDCSVAQARFETGDVLSIYTDGITETIGQRGEEFGEAGFLEVLRKNRELEASCILQNVQQAAEQFRLGEQEDDLTLIFARAL
jgi:serine phosphatase RsbU (regulator of sigma subunit)/ActR/RegA family two-component response regulator